MLFCNFDVRMYKLTASCGHLDQKTVNDRYIDAENVVMYVTLDWQCIYLELIVTKNYSYLILHQGRKYTLSNVICACE